MLKEYAENLIQGLVDKPEEVYITEKSGVQTVLLKVEVARGDMGCVIGKQGRLIDSVRMILEAVAAKNNKRIIVELIE